MKRTAFLLISLYMGLVGANAQSNKYDLNDDGDVNITDVTLLVTNILDQNNGNEYDLNDDEDVNITDVILMVNYILGLNNGNQGGGNGGGIGDTSQAYLNCPNNNHPHMIDLGLPSGTKWACCNVGATIPEGYGGYYSWGEVNEKAVYTQNTYKYYTQDGSYVSISFDISGTDYDVAHVKWGGNWCMPTNDQQVELLNDCTYEWTTLNGVKGGKFTGPSGGSIFLPAAGYSHKSDGGLDVDGIYGHYWSSTQYPDYVGMAYWFSFGSSNTYRSNFSLRFVGMTVRPVMK